jgi:Ni/Co efflux regulator RcnB
MKRDAERWAELVAKEDQERREREEQEKRERQEVERARGQAYGLRERQAEMYIDDYYEFNDDY